jgi:ABC-type sugar transport system ATPase subunit
MNLLSSRLFEGVAEAGVTVGVRPEHLHLGASSGIEDVGLRGRCELVEYLGPRIHVHLRVGGEVLTLLDDPADDVAVGDLIDCHVPRARLHRFDAASGVALAPAVAT